MHKQIFSCHMSTCLDCGVTDLYGRPVVLHADRNSEYLDILHVCGYNSTELKEGSVTSSSGDLC